MVAFVSPQGASKASEGIIYLQFNSQEEDTKEFPMCWLQQTIQQKVWNCLEIEILGNDKHI